MSQEKSSVFCTHGKGYNCRACYPCTTECEEIAVSLLPAYDAWNKSLPYVEQGHSMTKIKRFVSMKLRATESYVVMSNVEQMLIEKIMPNKPIL